MWKISYKLTKQFKNPDYKGPLRVAHTIKARIEKFKSNIAIIQVLCNPGLKERHWKQIHEVLGVVIDHDSNDSNDSNDLIINANSTLKDLLKSTELIEKHLDKIGEISSLASKEFTLETALKKMKQEWNSMYFTFHSYKETQMHVFASCDDLVLILEDHIIKTGTIKNSPFIKPFEQETLNWYNELVILIKLQ
jgi:dynein heavy chain